MENNSIKDFIWEFIKSHIPEKVQKIINAYMQKALDKLNSFTEEHLAENKKNIEKIGKCGFFACILFICIGSLSMATGSLAVAICLFMLGDSISYYLNIKKNIKKLFRIFLLWFLGLTLMCYISTASNLIDSLTYGFPLECQWDSSMLVQSFVVAFIITFIFHILNIGILLLLFSFFNILKKTVHIILNNKHLKRLVVFSICYFVERKIRILFNW
jgi:hypothetical protein|nr:MAG TPA: hypothetical protein [Caudoviricetes sp.]